MICQFKKIILFIYAISFLNLANSQNVTKKEIKNLKRINQNKQSYKFKREQVIELKTDLWNEKINKFEVFIKRFSPKLYNFLEANTSFSIKVNTEGIKKYRRINEKIISAEATGIKSPKLLTLIFQNEYADINYGIVRLLGKKYYNPLFYPKKYTFAKTINKGENKNLISYTFLPKKESKHLLKGYFYTTESNSIDFFYATPSDINPSINSFLALENIIIDSLPFTKLATSETEIASNNKRIGKIQISSTSKSTNITPSNERFKHDNIILDFDALNNKDSLNNEKIEKTLHYLDAIRYGRLGINKIDVLLKHLLNYNPIEGVRTGIGLSTNAKLNTTFDIGGYVAYGNRDKQIKYGVFNTIYLHKRSNTKMAFVYFNDLVEPGNVQFPFSKKIFYNEGFRKFGLTRLDRVQRFDAKLSTTLLSNIFMELQFNNRTHQALYQYQFNKNSTFGTSEIGLGIRYNPDEKFFKYNNRFYSLGSKYPSLFFNYNKSVNFTSNFTFYDYHKFDLKIEKKMNLLDYGTVDFQLIGGIISKNNLPYPFAYNMKGSFKPGTPIINNTFGTMDYNEFLATKYIAIFYQHNLGKIADKESFNPEFLVIHNMGWGNPLPLSIHEQIDLKSMEKGYFESGFYFKNLISLQNIIGNTGFGMGFIYRYGSYAHPKPLDNLVFKFSLDIDF